MKRRIFIGLMALVAIAILSIVVVRWLVPTAVEVAQAEEREIVETLVTTGFVEPASRTALAAEVSAQVQEVAVEEGDAVEQGQPLVLLDDTQGQLALEQADAAVREAQARLSGVVEQGAPTALEDVEQAALALQAAEEEYARAQQLFEAGVITGAEVDERRREVDRARSNLQRAQTVYQEMGVDGSTYDEAAAMLERADAERELARFELERYTVSAPVDATVLNVEVEPGNTVPAGEPVVVLAEGPIDIRITPDERELRALHSNQRALVVADAYPEQTFLARIHRIAPSVDPERATLTAYLRVEEPPGFLRADMTVTADIEVDRNPQALVVPRVSVRDLASGTPWVLQIEDGRAQRVNIDVGLVDDRYVEVTDGLAAHDEVVAATDVEPGDRVRSGEDYDVPEDEDAPGRPFEPGRVIAHAQQETP